MPARPPALLTPPLNHRNAVTELSITPLRPKTASVPLDGRVFKAATLDAELATELEGATLFEEAGLKKSYVVYWCQLSQLDNALRVKAKELKTGNNTLLFHSGCWDPTLIPNILRQSTDRGSSGSKTRRPRSNPPTRMSGATSSTPTTATRARQRAATSTSRSRSHRRESITRNIATTSVQETIKATVIPTAGTEEATVASWLNLIIASFKDLQAREHSGSSKSYPSGLDGPHLTRSAVAKSGNSLHTWSSHYAAKPVENSLVSIKPDIVFCGQFDSKTSFAWRNVISFLELTSSSHTAQLRRDITRKVYAVFMSQPSRRSVVAISIASQEFRLHVFDRSGAIHSLGHNIHKASDLFVCVLYALAFGSPAALGFDPTFEDQSISPATLYHLLSLPARRKSQKIYVRDFWYQVVCPIYASPLIRGRATNSWVIKREKLLYVVKDYWTHVGRRFTEEEILKKIAGLLGVPELVNAWTVQVNDADETTDRLRPASLFKNKTFGTRIRRRLVMAPVGEPLVQFSSLQELVSVFIDIVHVHYMLVHVYCVLHCDISINNFLVFICEKRWPTTSGKDVERKDVIAKKKLRRGLLIDFDYSSLLNEEKQGVSTGDRTGTIPFMSLDLLQESINPSPEFVHTYAHDLESLVYVLVWVCVLYQAPNEIRSDKTIEQTCLKHWSIAKNVGDVAALYDQKLGQLMSRSVLDHFMPYFEPLKPSVMKLYKLIQRSHDPDEDASLTHAAIKDILMDAFFTVPEVSCGATNAKRTWATVKELAPARSYYYSEGRSIRRKIV